MTDLFELRQALRLAAYEDEQSSVNHLLRAIATGETERALISRQAADLITRSRAAQEKSGALAAFLQEFDLTNQEGVAFMSLAEALLRIPDTATADALIAEKLRAGDWQAHRGQSGSLLVNASVWGIILSGKILALDRNLGTASRYWLPELVGRIGERSVRRAMLQAIRLMGNQYVLGGTIEEALERGPAENPPDTDFSFDMLGEGARTQADAARYLAAYEHAIQALADNSLNKQTDGVVAAHGISIKLSALHPRYQQSQGSRVLTELLPKVLGLATAAKRAGLGLNIDAEEATRLDLSLDIFEALARAPELEGWEGLGFVVQAYQKRAPAVVDWLIALGRTTRRRFMLRLVKGAYWDTEIKRAQVLGLTDYPVFTRKANTDLCYQVCAQAMLKAQDVIYPQFATHNALTVATIMQLAKPGQRYEFQRLHGMGKLLYQQLRTQADQEYIPLPRLRVYAPVGAHRDLLPYLVRRLLENGANSSFVHQLSDSSIPIETLTADVVDKVRSAEHHRHPAMPRPPDLYRQSEAPRANAAGMDLDDVHQAGQLLSRLEALSGNRFIAHPTTKADSQNEADSVAVCSPADAELALGEVRHACPEDLEAALAAATAAQPSWNAMGGSERAECIDAVAEAFTLATPELIHLISREAGRTLKDALAEVREAIDFCHYYAAQARLHFVAASSLSGPTGEQNLLALHGRGVFACISPWNFPLAIFTGQVIAALAAGNAVVAKPAEQTPLVAARAVALMHAAGIPDTVLHLLPGTGGEVGSRLVADPRVSGVAFTGSIASARRINRQLAERPGPIVPLVAETGGINAMIADASALPEQLVDDVITSAFLSAGQRCSAARVLFLQEDIIEPVMNMLIGACDELTLGMPWTLAADIGPVIDKTAQATLQEHIAHMTETATLLYAYPKTKLPAKGSFVGPHIFQLNNLNELEREVFGPILHVISYPGSGLDEVLEQINSTGYGLTLGVHTRLYNRAQHIIDNTRVGNCYINRNMVGAVVGVNPFGGQGLSGTGPKAGGPHYLLRFATEKTITRNTTATGGNIELFKQMGDG